MLMLFVQLRLHTARPTTDILLQVSTVCHKFAQAVTQLQPSLYLWSGLDSDATLNFSSKLMLAWAPSVREMRLCLSSGPITGLASFAAKATQLALLSLAGDDLLACAQAGDLLQTCVGLKTKVCSDLIVPTVYPLCLQELDIALDKLSGHFSKVVGQLQSSFDAESGTPATPETFDTPFGSCSGPADCGTAC